MAVAVIGPWELVAAGVTMLMLGMTATVRQFHVQQARLMQNAFELGRDIGRGEGRAEWPPAGVQSRQR